MNSHRFAALVLGVVLLAAPSFGQDNIGHERHLHRHNDKHPAAPDASRFTTSRDAAAILPLPHEEDAFFFVVFGDRTGGPTEGVSVLADAVRDTNLLEPDLVMTVGDLVEGYNTREPWMKQMEEFKGIMDRLICPWFPVPGNHDIYWRGAGAPKGEHEQDYEKNFGPLWYAFEHKNCWFISLYSDEGNPETGEKSISKPESQRMSEEQFNWLRDTLERTKSADHVFLFLHHPRWLKGNYGDDWEKVHQLLRSAGNVTAVFGGHIHRMRSDGPRDGIEYITLATVGGGQSGAVPDAGWLHHILVVTVRKQQVALAAIPVGEVMDVREITGQLADEANLVSNTPATVTGEVVLGSDGSADSVVQVALSNPGTRDIDVTVTPDSDDSRWVFSPDHAHGRIGPGESRTFDFGVRRITPSIDIAYREPVLYVQRELLAPGHRYEVPERAVPIPVAVNLTPPAIPAGEMAMSMSDGPLVVPSDSINLPDGPITLECWFSAERFAQRTGLLAKTESSDYGIFVNSGRPSWSVFVGDSYLELTAGDALSAGTWHHVAGVYDGREARLYVNGKLVASEARAGERRTNSLPLMIGADVDGRGNPTSAFDGLIDSVRLSAKAEYAGESFAPARRAVSTPESVLVLNFDGLVGPWLFDESPRARHPRARGVPTVPAR